MENKKEKITIGVCGAGHVAHHLIPALSLMAKEMVLYNRSSYPEALKAQLACKTHVITTPNFSNYDIDVLILIVKDDTIASLYEQIVVSDKALVLHTSGTVSIAALASKNAPQYGCLYPLQTFSKTKKMMIEKK